MFAHGTKEAGKMVMSMYSSEAEDFSSDASHLDTWVFDQVDDFLKNARDNQTLRDILNREKVVFFLHLLGLDTNGHAHRPHSREYLENISLADKGIAEFVKKLEDFYNHDEKTAYIFTADHGMSDRGSHGDGNPDNTETPLIAWGAGISGPINSKDDSVLQQTRDWDMQQLLRRDVKQADIAPLMSSLIGAAFPMNSVGQLPFEYLSNTEEYKANTALSNSKQILSQFLVKQKSKQQTELFFEPFKPLKFHHEIIKGIETKIKNNQFQHAQQDSIKFLLSCVEGLRYYQIYDWLFLRSIISIGYLGWIVYSLLFTFKTYSMVDSHKYSSYNPVLYVLSGISSFFLGLILFLKDSPFLYYIYVAFPIYFWTSILSQQSLIKAISKQSFSTSNLILVTFYILVLEILVSSYFYREVLTPCLWVIGLGWPISMERSFFKKHKLLMGAWVIACACTSIFTLIPIDKVEYQMMVYMSF